MIKPGGTEGGMGKFLLGLVLAAVSLYFFFDSVRVDTRGSGLISGGLRGMRGGGGGGGGGRGSGLWETTSMGVIFMPFMIGLIALFYDSTKKWAWGLSLIGVAIVVIEILSRIRFDMTIKVSHLMIMFVTFAAGAGLMLQSYRDERRDSQRRDEDELGLGRGPGVSGGVAGRESGVSAEDRVEEKR